MEAAASMPGPVTAFCPGSDELPRVRYVSGDVVHAEELVGGRLVGRYWSAVGRANNAGWDLWGNSRAFRLDIDGCALDGRWRWCGCGEIPGDPDGARHCVLHLESDAAPVRVAVHTRLDGTPAVERWLEITNTGDRVLAVDGVAPWCGMLWRDSQFSIGTYTDDRWAMEGWFEWRRMTELEMRVRADGGLRKHRAPFFIARNDVSGEAFAGHLAWSADWELFFLHDRSGLAFDFGPADQTWPLRTIAPGETIVTPAVHLAHTSGDLDRLVQAMHDHIRRSVRPAQDPDRLHRAQVLIPGDQGYHTPLAEETACTCIDLAAEIGSELFILDFGWWDATCDWFPSKERYPNGLEPVIAHARRRGLMFGLYLETEGGRGNIRESRAYRDHPDWFWPGDVLDLTNPAAAQWMEREICRLVEQYELDLFRLDYNQMRTLRGPTAVRNGVTENCFWRYCDALYGIYERVRQRYPRLILQQASAGGGRNDLGIAARFHENYLTDGLWFPRMLETYAGATLGLPPETLAIAYFASGGAGLGFSENLETTLRVSYALSFPHVFGGWIGGSVADMPPDRIARFRRYDALYKEFIRPLLPTCRTYHHAPVSSRHGVSGSDWFAMEFAAPDRTKGWALVARLRADPAAVPAGAGDPDTYVLRCRGVDPGRTYRVTFDSLDAAAEIDGLRLRDGVRIRLESAGMSELLLFEAIA